MPGEPGWFDVTKLEAIEIDEPGVEFPSNIIDWREDFYLKAYFEGPPSETEWQNMTDGELPYTARFYAKAMSPGVDDLDLGSANGELDPGIYQYEVASPTTNVEAEGIWRCGVTVTFRLTNGRRYHGVLGFNEDCVIQISISEERG
jgi:hypothetical protein